MKKREKFSMYRKSVLLLIIVMFLTFIAGCSAPSGSRISTEKFISSMEGAGYDVEDKTEEIKAMREFFAETLETALISVGDEYWYNFFEFVDDRYAKLLFESTRNTMGYAQGSILSFHSEITQENYEMYSFVSEGMYSHLMRVYNVIIFIEADSNHRSHIRGVLGSF